MSFFKEVEGEAAILVDSGVYRQVPLYTRDGFIYAKVGSGFVRLMADGATTKASTRLDFLSWNGPLAKDNLGRLCEASVAGAKMLAGDAQQKLIRGGS